MSQLEDAILGRSRLCSFTGCDRNAVTKLNFCLLHYKRWRRHGDPTVVAKIPRTGKCQVPTCGREDFARGYCGRHVQRLYKNLPMDEMPSLLERLENFIESDNGCWEWQGALAGNETHKYGQITFLNQRVQIHRVMFELFVGHVTSESLVCHRCDNPACIRPDHLFLGTTKDNSEDMVAKGRHHGPFKAAHP